MASYTTSLKLLKKDPTVDGGDTFNIETMLNDNWDKLDTAVTAMLAAGDYKPTSAYAVGDYCIHEGKLYKCITAITAGEPWTPTHWKETDVGAELERKQDRLTAGTNISITDNVISSTGSLPPRIMVTGETGAVVTAVCGDMSVTGAEGESGYTLTIPSYGTWIVSMTSGTITERIAVTVDQVREYLVSFAKSYPTEKTTVDLRPGNIILASANCQNLPSNLLPCTGGTYDAVAFPTLYRAVGASNGIKFSGVKTVVSATLAVELFALSNDSSCGGYDSVREELYLASGGLLSTRIFKVYNTRMELQRTLTFPVSPSDIKATISYMRIFDGVVTFVKQSTKTCYISLDGGVTFFSYVSTARQFLCFGMTEHTVYFIWDESDTANLAVRFDKATKKFAVNTGPFTKKPGSNYNAASYSNSKYLFLHYDNYDGQCVDESDAQIAAYRRALNSHYISVVNDAAVFLRDDTVGARLGVYDPIAKKEYISGEIGLRMRYGSSLYDDMVIVGNCFAQVPESRAVIFGKLTFQPTLSTSTMYFGKKAFAYVNSPSDAGFFDLISTMFAVPSVALSDGTVCAYIIAE